MVLLKQLGTLFRKEPPSETSPRFSTINRILWLRSSARSLVFIANVVISSFTILIPLMRYTQFPYEASHHLKNRSIRINATTEPTKFSETVLHPFHCRPNKSQLTRPGLVTLTSISFWLTIALFIEGTEVHCSITGSPSWPVTPAENVKVREIHGKPHSSRYQIRI